MKQYWETDFDPYEALIQCHSNIQQCALAINHSTEVMKDLAAKYNHQQEVIQQLQFQNRKLTAQLNQLQAHAYFNQTKN
jgi:hypothetical protein